MEAFSPPSVIPAPGFLPRHRKFGVARRPVPACRGGIIKTQADGKLLRRQCNTNQEAFTAVVTKGEDMGRSFRFMAFRCAAALPLCWVACVLSHGMALAQSKKITTFQAGCSADSAPCSKGMVFGFQGNFETVKNQPYK